MNIQSFFRKKIVNKNTSDTNKNIITGTTRDYSDLLKYDTTLKVWMPEAPMVALAEIISLNNKDVSDYAVLSISDYIRKILFLYLYGQYDLAAASERGNLEFTYTEDYGGGGFNFSKIPQVKNRTIELGKNNYDLKIKIANKMKSDLQQLADKSDLKLSMFIREILISSLFGHAYLSERDEMIPLMVEIDESTTMD